MPTYLVQGNAYVRPLYVDAPEELAEKYAEIEEEVALRLRKYPKSPEGFVLILDKRGYGLMSAVPKSVVDQVKSLPKGKGKVYGLIVAIDVAKSRVVTGKKEEEELIEEVEENPQAEMTLKDKRLLEKYHKFLVVFGNTFQVTGLPTSVMHKPVKVEAKPKPLPTEKESMRAFEEIKRETEEQVVKDAVKMLQSEGKTTLTLAGENGKFFDVKITAKEISENNLCGMPEESVIKLFETVSKAKTGAGLNRESKEIIIKVVTQYCKSVRPPTTRPSTPQNKTVRPPTTTPSKPTLRIKTPPPPPRYPVVSPYVSKYTPRVTPHQFTRAVHEHLKRVLGGNNT